jgi:hypothetical protein
MGKPAVAIALSAEERRELARSIHPDDHIATYLA